MHEIIYTKGNNGHVYGDLFLDDDWRTVINHFSPNDNAIFDRLHTVYALGTPISFKKYQNLQQLRRYISLIDHSFTKTCHINEIGAAMSTEQEKIFIQMNKSNDMTNGSLFQIPFHLERTEKGYWLKAFFL